MSWGCASPGRRSIVSRLGRRFDYDAISGTVISNERYDTTVFIGTTSAIDIIRELNFKLLRLSIRRGLEDMSEHEGIE